MFTFRFFLIITGTLLVALGLSMTMVAAAGVISDTQSGSLSPFDQVDDVSEPDKGFIPMIIPTVKPAGTLAPDRAATQSSSVFPDAGPTLTVTQAGPTATPEPTWVPNRIVIP